jgi:hypothetical protein
MGKEDSPKLGGGTDRMLTLAIEDIVLWFFTFACRAPAISHAGALIFLRDKAIILTT